MRFLGDIPIARATLQHLRASGHDAISVSDRLPPTASDSEILRIAAGEQRIGLCFDLGMAARVAMSGGTSPSVITFRTRLRSANAVDSRLDAILPRLARELSGGALITVEEQAVRVRALPVYTRRKP